MSLSTSRFKNVTGARRLSRFQGLLGALFVVLALSCLVIVPPLAMAADVQTPTDKDETVYIYADATGKLKSAEVSVLLRNGSAASELRDSSSLANLAGKDDVSFTGSGDSIVWAANGKNVSYTGTTTVQVPVTLKATYTIDGKAVTPEQLAGKSGHVTIKYEFENHASTTAEISGSTQTVYIPFTCVTAIMLDGNDFMNVAVENCKVINDGDDMIVAGYAMPGLKESLGSMGEDADIPNSFSISADVTGFELKSTMTVVTAGILSDINADSLGFEIDGDASALTDAMNQLIRGSDSLTTGLDKLAENLNGLEDGTSAIKHGTEELGYCLSALAGEDGLLKLAGYEYAVAESIGKLGDSADEMKRTLLDAANELSEASTTGEAFDNAKDIMADHVQDIVGEGKLSQAEYTAIMTALETGSSMSESLPGVAEILEAAAGSIETLKGKVSELKSKTENIASEIESAAAVAAQLAGGANELEGYADQLNQAAPALAEGAQVAADGSKTLADGMRALNDEGIAQLVSAIQDKLGGFSDRINALSNASKSYTNFSGLTPGTNGSVKFIIETDPIKKA